MGKIIDCITFFNENFIFDLRYKTLENFVDEFVVCESISYIRYSLFFNWFNKKLA